MRTARNGSRTCRHTTSSHTRVPATRLLLPAAVSDSLSGHRWLALLERVTVERPGHPPVERFTLLDLSPAAGGWNSWFSGAGPITSVEADTMPWGVDDLPGVTRSDTAMTAEWRARQEQRGKRRYRPQPRHEEPEPAAQTPASPAPRDADTDAPVHHLNILA